MAKLTRQQIESLWVQAGGNPQNAATASAIAMAESGGDTDSKNDRNSNGTIDRGLWQVNSVHGSLSTFDPLANARAAVSISSNGANWKPWCVAWSDGACGGTFMGAGAPVLKFLGLSGGADSTVGGTLSAAVAPQGFTQTGLGGSALNPKEWANAFLQPIGVWVYAFAIFMMGLALMGIGFWLLFRETQIGAAVEGRALKLGKAAVGALPGGGAVTATADAVSASGKKESVPPVVDAEETNRRRVNDFRDRIDQSANARAHAQRVLERGEQRRGKVR